jgi:hypothetical protein
MSGAVTQLRPAHRNLHARYRIDGLNYERILFAVEALGDAYGPGRRLYWSRLGEQRDAREARMAPEHLPERLAGTARLSGVRLTRR